MKPRLINAPNDPEKMVTPGIIYCRVTRDGLTGHFLGVGWWHWGVGVTWIFETSEERDMDATKAPDRREPFECPEEILQ